MFRNHDYQVNKKLKNIPFKCSFKDQHFKITNQLWNSLMQKLCQEYQESNFKVSVDLIDENDKEHNKKSISITKTIKNHG